MEDSFNSMELRERVKEKGVKIYGIWKSRE
jgi:hypothetical protein